LNNSFNAIHRFYTEEIQGQQPGLSRKQAGKLGRARAYQVISAADAVNRIIQTHNPDAIRISCHPQPFDTRKIGITLTGSRQNITPWHSAAVECPDGTDRLLKAGDALRQDLTPVAGPGGERADRFRARPGQTVEVPGYGESQPPGLSSGV
jgi:hypothetical protein